MAEHGILIIAPRAPESCALAMAEMRGRRWA